MKRNNILFLVPDGVGVRNYLYSDIIKHLKNENNLVIWTCLPKSALNDADNLHKIKFNYKHLKLHSESVLTRVYRESAAFARLILNSKNMNNSTILTNWNYSPSSIKLKALNFICQKIGNWASKNYNYILNLEISAKNNWSRVIVDSYKEQLIEINANKIFITHQRVASLMPICIAAKELNIEVITAIYSWDNLPKARLAVQADKYLVWSEYMKEEMKLYYPEINQNNVVVTGTPQFEFYLQNDRILNRNDFALKFGLDSSKKWICFSGDDQMTSPYDPFYIRDVASTLLELDAKDRPQIIFRRCPVDYSDRYNKVLKEFEDNIFTINPEWNVPNSVKNWGFVFPKYEDIDLQVNIAFHCELVINLGSTMAHDFAIFNKPCFYLNYNIKEDKKWSVETIYKFQHFRSMKDLDAVCWLNDPNEISSKIANALLNKDNLATEKNKWMDIVVSNRDTSSFLISQELL